MRGFFFLFPGDLWTVTGRGYLDVVRTGVLGDLFGHRVVNLPRHVHLLIVHAVL